MKILLLDDDNFLLDMYSAKFAKGGHEVVCAKSVEEALDNLRAHQDYDAILFDMVLPGATGMDFLRKVKEEKLEGHAKLVVLSNQSAKEEIDAARAAGATGYIIKAHMIPSQVMSEVEEIVAAPAV